MMRPAAGLELCLPPSTRNCGPIILIPSIRSSTILCGNGFKSAFVCGNGVSRTAYNRCAFIFEITENEGQLLSWAAFFA